MNVVDLFKGTLVAGSHAHLLAFCTLLTLCLFLVELLQLLPELVGGLLLELATTLLLVFVLLVDHL